MTDTFSSMLQTNTSSLLYTVVSTVELEFSYTTHALLLFMDHLHTLYFSDPDAGHKLKHICASTPLNLFRAVGLFDDLSLKHTVLIPGFPKVSSVRQKQQIRQERTHKE